MQRSVDFFVSKKIADRGTNLDGSPVLSQNSATAIVKWIIDFICPFCAGNITSIERMNWRHVFGIISLLVTTVFVLNIGIFIHLSLPQQVFNISTISEIFFFVMSHDYLWWSYWSLMERKKSILSLSLCIMIDSRNDQIGYPGEREISLPSCASVPGPKSLPDSLRFLFTSHIFWLDHFKLDKF